MTNSKPRRSIMQNATVRTHLLALTIALSLGIFCSPVHAMTSDQAHALVKAAVSQKDATALAKLQAAAQSGDANAQYWLAVMYDNGLGVPQRSQAKPPATPGASTEAAGELMTTGGMCT